MTPLMYAVKDNRTPILDRLIELGSDVGARNNVRTYLKIKHFITPKHLRNKLKPLYLRHYANIQPVNDLVNFPTKI